MCALRFLAALVALVLTAACGAPEDADLAELRAELQALRQQESQAKVELERIEEEGVAAVESEDAAAEDEGPDAVVSDSSKLDIPFNYNNFRVTLGTAEVSPASDTTGAHVLIDIVCENLIDQQAYCPDQVKLESNREFYGPSGADVPYVPGKRSAVGSYRFPIDEKFRLANAVLLVGDAPKHVASIPLCPGKGTAAPVLLEPVTRPVSGTATAGNVTVSLTGLELRADGPQHATRDGDKLTLVLTVDIAALKASRGAYYLNQHEFDLKRPDGNTSEAEEWSISDQYVDNDLNEKGVTIAYEVDNPPAGSYTLQFSGWDEQGESVTAPLTFAISE